MRGIDFATPGAIPGQSKAFSSKKVKIMLRDIVAKTVVTGALMSVCAFREKP